MSAPITSTPFVLRQWSLEHEVRPTVEEVFAERPAVQSILLCVAQYWADEADDAVHGHLVFSSRATPRWPHRCDDTYEGTRGDGDLCSSCAWDSTPEGLTTWVSWDDNGVAIRAWQALCAEGASQEDDPNTVYSPVVLARRTGASFSLERVGALMRPWLDLPGTALPVWFQDAGASPELVTPASRDAEEQPFRDAIARSPFDDGPRLVFADWLLQRQDPLGEFISLSVAKARTPDLEARRRVLHAAHAQAWLGALSKVVSPDGADFSRGLLTGATVHFDASTRPLASSPLFSTVETLRFGPTSEVVFSKSMTALRAVVGLRAKSPPLPASVASVACPVEVACAGLPAHVTALTAVCGPGQSEAAVLAALDRAGVLPRLTHLSLVRTEPFEGAPVPLRRENVPASFAVGGWSEGQQPTGWWLDAQGGLRLMGLSRWSDSASAIALASVLPPSALPLVPGPLWSPSIQEVAALEAALKTPVSVIDAKAVEEPAPLDPPTRAPPVAMPVHVDPITRAVQLQLPSGPDAGPKRGSRAPPLTVVLLALGVLGLVARACATAG